MSVQSEINRINENVANTYSTLEEAGATMPQTRNSNNLPGTAASISAVLYGKEQTLTPEQKAQARTNIGAKTPYEYAQNGGYTGTEEEFAEKLAEEAPKLFEVTITENEDGTYTSSHYYADVKKAYDSGRVPIAVRGKSRYQLIEYGSLPLQRMVFGRQEGSKYITITVDRNTVKVETTTMATPADIPDINQKPFYLLANQSDDGSYAIISGYYGNIGTVDVTYIEDADEAIRLGRDAYIQGRAVFLVIDFDGELTLPCTFYDEASALFELSGGVFGYIASVDFESRAVTLETFEIPEALPNPNPLTINGQNYDGSEEISVNTKTCVTITDNGDGFGSASIPLEQVVSLINAGTDVYCSMLSEGGLGNIQMRLSYYDPENISVTFAGDDFVCTTRKVVLFIGDTDVQIIDFPLGKSVVTVTDSGDGKYSIDKTLEELAASAISTFVYVQVDINNGIPTMLPMVYSNPEGAMYKFEGLSNNTFIEVLIFGEIVTVMFEDFDEKVNGLIDANVENRKLAKKAQGIFYIVGDSTTAGVWTGTSQEITEYFDGLTVAYKTNIAGVSGGSTLNINGLGAIPVKRNAETAVTTTYPAGSVILLTYSEGSWLTADYDANTKNTTGTSNKAATKLFLTGATSQTSSGTTTYSNENCYIGTNNRLYSAGEVVPNVEEITALIAQQLGVIENGSY